MEAAEADHELTEFRPLEPARLVGIVLVENRLRLRNIRLEPKRAERRAQLQVDRSGIERARQIKHGSR